MKKIKEKIKLLLYDSAIEVRFGIRKFSNTDELLGEYCEKYPKEYQMAYDECIEECS